jgi:hypothetical protein
VNNTQYSGSSEHMVFMLQYGQDQEQQLLITIASVTTSVLVPKCSQDNLNNEHYNGE